ncbi:MAG: hypothetical protein AB7S71_02115 [Dongiaceae bacterium]
MTKLGLDSFQRQFVLTRREVPVPPAFLTEDLGDWRLSRHPELHSVRVHDQGGAQLGWLLGEPIDVTAQSMMSHDLRLGVTTTSGTKPELSAIAGAVKNWAGWYLLVLVHPQLDCIITDSGARLPCFYDENSGAIASSPALITGIEAYERELRTDLLAAVDIDGKGWLPFGLTASPGFKRVPPNHRLHLGDLTTTRVWPAGPVVVQTSHEGPVKDIAGRLKAVIATLMEPEGAWLPLTAGRESRTLLALSRAHIGNLHAYTLLVPGTEVDGAIAAKLASIAGIPHHPLALIKSTEPQRQAWLTRTGHVVGDENPRLFNTFGLLGSKRPALTGLGGEVARAFYWLRDDRSDGTIDPSSLLRRLDMPQHAALLEAAKRWLESLDHFDLFTKLDLAYIEQRLGCWGAPPPFGLDFVYRDFCPFIQQAIFEAMLALPHEFRRSQKLASEIIGQEWPELLQLPFNRLSGLAHYVSLAKKATDPARIRRKLRRLIASR